VNPQRALPGAADVARMLAADMPSLVAELLPAARRHGREMVVGSIYGEVGTSLSVCVAGARAGLWADFAGGASGDALDLAAAVLFGGDRGLSWRWGLRKLGYAPPGEAGGATAPVAPAPSQDRSALDAEMAAKRRKALALFLEAMPLTGDCPASLYLAGRGIALRELGRIPRALRFHPRCWCAEIGTPLPAMLASIIDADGQHIAVHRTFLVREEGAWRKAGLANAKKVLGAFAAGHIPLWRGSSGKPLRAAAHGEHLVVAEGIESGLSCAVLAPEMRVIAAVSVSNLSRLDLPDTITRLTLAADGDAPESAAAIALARAAERFVAQGREVFIAQWEGGDANDALNAAKDSVDE
jgi:hypothetical protein